MEKQTISEQIAEQIEIVKQQIRDDIRGNLRDWDEGRLAGLQLALLIARKSDGI